MSTAPGQDGARASYAAYGAKGAIYGDGHGAGWSTWVSQTGRWWAVHDQALSPGELAAGCRLVLYAEDFATLTGRICEQDKLRGQLP